MHVYFSVQRPLLVRVYIAILSVDANLDSIVPNLSDIIFITARTQYLEPESLHINTRHYKLLL